MNGADTPDIVLTKMDQGSKIAVCQYTRVCKTPLRQGIVKFKQSRVHVFNLYFSF